MQARNSGESAVVADDAFHAATVSPVKIEHALEQIAGIVGAAEMRKADELETHRDHETRLRVQCLIGPLDGLLVSSRGHMSEAEPPEN